MVEFDRRELNEVARQILKNEDEVRVSRYQAQKSPEADDSPAYTTLYNRLYGPPATQSDCSVSPGEQLKTYAKGIGSGLAVGTAGAVGETFLLCSGPGAFACAIAPGIPATIATVTFLGSGFVGGRSAYNSIKEAEAICLDKKKSQK